MPPLMDPGQISMRGKSNPPGSSRRPGPRVVLGMGAEPSGARIDGRMYIVIHYASLAGIGAHALFIPLFWAAAVPALALFNILSVLAWALARWLNNHQRQGLAVVVLCSEVVLHAALAVSMLGLDSGFQLYLVPLIPFLFFYSRAGERVLATGAIAVMAVFITLNWAYADLQSPLEPRFAGVFTALGLIVPLTTLGVMSFYYRRASLRSELRMERLASHDPLTRLVNRRRMLQRMSEEQQRTERGASPFSLVMADIDHFKRINDEQGHECGDDVLIGVARRLRAGLRAHDVVARWGGEEFLLLLPDTDVAQARLVTERLRQCIASPDFSDCGLPRRVTMTFGIAQFEPGMGLPETVRSADEALYEGKAHGRNCVMVESRFAGHDG